MEPTIFFIAIIAIEIVFVLYNYVPYCVVRLDKNIFAEGVERFTTNGIIYCAYTVGSENCLFLNIYAIKGMKTMDNENQPHLLPVMFWVHGGSFNIGSADSDINTPDYILEKDIAVVTINYRLGPFGFLAYGNVTANIGLHDQRVALKWTYDNIKHFGGNPRKITLGGWSAGAASISFHLYSKKSKNLFDKAIMMSGNMLNPWAFEPDVFRCTYELLRKLNIPNSSDIGNELKTVEAYDFIPPLFSDELKIDFFGSQQFCFIPTIDKEFTKLLPQILSHRRPASNVPIMVGMTSLESEWNMLFETSNAKYPNKNLIIQNLINNFMTEFLENRYDGVEKENFKRNLQHIADMSYGIYNFIQHYTSMTKQKKVFLYRFAFDGKLCELKEKTNITGATHGDDLRYLFKNFLEEDIADEGNYDPINLSNAILTRERMVTMWTNFIKFGNPNLIQDSIGLSSNVAWPSFNNEEKLFLNIDTNTTIEHLDDKHAAFQLWDSIYQCLYNVLCDDLNEYLFNKIPIIF